MTKNTNSTHSFPQKPSSFSSKQIKILEAYIQLCAQYGVGKVTLEKVASYLRISLGTVHYHFGGKKGPGLLPQSIKYVSQESYNYIAYYLEEKIHKDDFSGIDSYIDTLFSWAQIKITHAQFWMYYFYLSSINSEHQKTNEKYLMSMEERVRSVLLLSQRKKIYKKFAIKKSLCKKLHAQITGCIILAGCRPTQEVFETQKKIAINACRELISIQEIKSIK